MKVGCYVRVSTLEQAENGHSIEEQTERLRKYCDAMDWEIYKVYTDAGLSGANMERPALKSLIRDVKKKKIEKVVVYKLDRLSRSQKDTLNLIEEVFLKNKVDFISMNENFDTSSAFGRAMIGILAVFAQLEREQIKERMAMGKIARAKQGEFMGTWQIPIGYDYIDGELVTNEFEKIQIQKIFEWYAAGVSPVHIADRLNDSGMIQKNGRWLPYTVRQILDRKTYLGYIFYKGEWYKGTHEAFISEELFEQVQLLRKKKADEHQKHNSRSGKATSYLGGLCFCANCGAKYFKQMSQTTKNGERCHINYYVCASRSKKNKYYNVDPNCKNKRYRMDELDEAILGEIKKLANEPELLEEVKRPDSSEEISIVQRELEAIESQLNKYMDLYAVDGISIEQLKERVSQIDDKREKLERHLEELRQDNLPRLSKEEAFRVLNTFEDILKTGSLEEVRALIETLICKIVIDEENISIHWNF